MSLDRIPRALSIFLLLLFATLIPAAQVPAQEPAAGTREGTIVAAQEEKSKQLKPYQPPFIESYLQRVQTRFEGGEVTWHPFFESAYAGGSFTLGLGYFKHVSAYNTIDLRGSYTVKSYKRLEAEFLAPRLLARRASVTVTGGWREATQVGFYGVGPSTSSEARANYAFDQPYGRVVFEMRPARNMLVLGAGTELSTWNTASGSGSAPSVDEVYTPETLPGLGASPTYIHLQGTAALDWRPAPGYSRRGGYAGLTGHDYSDTGDQFSFRQVDLDLIQHVPIFTDTWVLSFRGHVETTHKVGDQEIPYFMLPALGGGSSLRGYSSWRFRDRNALLLSAEWRILVNRFLDSAVFYDAGKVASRAADLDFDHLESSVGFGFRFHGPATTPLRVEIARSHEGVTLVFSAHGAF